MVQFAPRVPLSVGLVLGLVTGCGKSTPPSQPEPAPASTPSTLTSEDIQRLAPGTAIEEALMGRFPGVMVERTDGGGVSVRIRGAASFYASEQPLYVIDDIPIQAGPNGSLYGLNPHDIATIRVLKNPADTAIYGVRGANGVIVITTKRPGQYKKS